MKRKIIIAAAVILVIALMAFFKFGRKTEEEDHTLDGPGTVNPITGFYWAQTSMSMQGCFRFEVYTRDDRHVFSYSYFDEKGDIHEKEEKKLSESDWRELRDLLDDCCRPETEDDRAGVDPNLIVLDGPTRTLRIYREQGETFDWLFKDPGKEYVLKDYLKKLAK